MTGRIIPPSTESSAAKKPKPSKDDEGFIFTAPRTRKQHNKAAQERALLSKNSFAYLSDSEMSMEDTQQQPKQQQNSPPRRRKHPNPIVPAVKKLPKPIFVTETSYEVLKNSIESLNLPKMPTFSKRRGNVYSVMAGNVEEKKKILEKLKTVQHFTFTETQDRHLLFVLLGHHDTTVEKLLEDLKASEIPAKKVSKINRSIEDPIFLVSFEKNAATLSDLTYKHNTINGLRIRWDKYKPVNKRPTQCRRCQRFGHAANNCNLTFRCVKCLEEHEPGACSRISRDEGLPSCVNCQLEGHASNSARCPALKKHIENINLKKKPSQNQPREFPATRFDWNKQRPAQYSSLLDYNNNFPYVASQHPQSTSQVLPTVNRGNREYRPALTHSVNRQLPRDKDIFSQLSNLQSEFMSLQDMNETINLYFLLLEELKTAKSHSERLMVLLKHTERNSQPFHVSP